MVPVDVLDHKWIQRFGGDPAVSLDHGWYRSSRGERIAAEHLGGAKFFGSSVSVMCDYCAHGWLEDVRWRAEPALLDLAEARTVQLRSGSHRAGLVRWSQATAMLAEHLDGMPRASSAAQRQAVRQGEAPGPDIATWWFSTRQRLPARVHLSQVSAVASGESASLVQIVSIELARLTVLVVLPSDEQALGLVRRSAISVEFGPVVTDDSSSPVRSLDLSRTPHPHRIAVQRICAASSANVCP